MIIILCTNQGKEMTLADRLSRFPSRSENLPIELHHNIQHITFTSDKTNIIRGATKRDPILYPVYCITLNGWPSRFQDVPCIACQYWGARDELTIDNSLLLKGEREFVYLLNYTKEHLMIFMKATKVLKNATHHKRENLLARNGCRHHRVCKTLYNLHKAHSNSGNTTNDTPRHTRRPMARSSSRLFSSQQHRIYSHCRHIQ